MQAIGRQPQRAPDGAPLHYECHRPEQTTLCRLLQQHATSFISHTEATLGRSCPASSRMSDAFLECCVLAHGFLRLRCGECGHNKLLAFSASGEAFVLHAARAGCQRRQRIWWTTLSRMCRCGSGSCPCPSRCTSCCTGVTSSDCAVGSRTYKESAVMADRRDGVPGPPGCYVRLVPCGTVGSHPPR